MAKTPDWFSKRVAECGIDPRKVCLAVITDNNKGSDKE